ncbi:unnamed protein product [Mytilus coruscus]|uniref:Uncharacterized protein n=1 Tax=Mytilus coruscus TaxID=42192 RepID=A0A6J8A586_MYTCO|nr:unnamed protein product [Mytilus coruscus]
MNTSTRKIIEISRLIVVVLMLKVTSSADVSTAHYLTQSQTKPSLPQDKVLNSLVNSTLVLETSFSSNNLKSAVSALLDAFSGFSTGDGLGNVASVDRISAIKSSLSSWNDNLFQTAKKVKRLFNLFHLFQLRRTFDAYEEDIEKCFNNLKQYLSDPSSYRQNFMSCYEVISPYTLEIGKLLNGQSVTFFKGNLFYRIMDETSYCDGTQILDLFKFILGVYTKGCLITIAAEPLKLGSNSSIYKQCQNDIESAFSKYTTINLNCKFQPCDTIFNVLQEHSNESNVSILSNRFRNIFPWYYFVIIYFNNEDISNIEFFGETLNRLVIPRSGKVKKIIMWSEFANKYTHEGTERYAYGIRYPKALVKAKIDQMNMTIPYTMESAQLNLIGYREYTKAGKTHSRCISVHSADGNEDGSSIKMPRWELASIFGGVAGGFLFICYCIATCYM